MNAASKSRKGLLLAIAASLVLLALAAYRVPLLNKELHGTVVGVSEVHNEKGSQMIAVVELDTGAQIFASIPRDLLKGENISVRVNEASTLFGRKSYSIISANE